MKTLIVEHDEAGLRLVEILGRELGLELLPARTGLEALNLFHHERPSLVVLSWASLGDEALATCQRMRTLPASATSVIVMLADRAHQGEFLKTLEAGADDFIAKPVTEECLHARL